MQEKHKLKAKINFLAYYQIVGGAIGIIFLVWLLVSTLPVQGFNIVLFLMMAVFFALSICAGWLLVEKRIEAGLTLSKINQILQIIGFGFGAYGFKYVAGIMLSLGIDLKDDANFIFNFSISKLEFFINSTKDLAKVEVNLVAIYLVYFIIKIQDTILYQRKIGLVEENN